MVSVRPGRSTFPRSGLRRDTCSASTYSGIFLQWRRYQAPKSKLARGGDTRGMGRGRSCEVTMFVPVVRSVARVEPRLCRRRCHRRDGESESDQLDGEPLPAFHLNSLSRVFCHISTVRRAWVPVVRSRDSRSVKLLIGQRGSGSASRASPGGLTALLRHLRPASTESYGMDYREPRSASVGNRPKLGFWPFCIAGGRTPPTSASVRVVPPRSSASMRGRARCGRLSPSSSAT